MQRQFEFLKGTSFSGWTSNIVKPLNREQMLQQQLNQAKAEFDSLNVRSLEYKALKRDADADKTLYEELTGKINEAGINDGFQGSSIRLADLARPALRARIPENEA